MVWLGWTQLINTRKEVIKMIRAAENVSQNPSVAEFRGRLAEALKGFSQRGTRGTRTVEEADAWNSTFAQLRQDAQRLKLDYSAEVTHLQNNGS